MATVERRLPGGNRMRLSYANGEALAMPVSVHPRPAGPGVGDTAPASRADLFDLAFRHSGRHGTRWRASYRWQPEDTVTAVAPFAVNAVEPYLNLHLRQPICLRREGTAALRRLLDVQNLLAQGYRPYMLSDGSLLVFAQDQRSIRAGLTFTF